MSGDEELYEYAIKEVETNGVSNALWAKALVKSNNNPELARSIYIELRVEALKDEMESQALQVEYEEIQKEIKQLKIQSAFWNTISSPLFWVALIAGGYYLLT